MSNIDDLFDSVFGSTSTKIVVQAPKARRTQSPIEPQGPQSSSGVPISRADWNYVEDVEDTTPRSKRYNRQRSGRAGRRMYNSLRTVQAVGGYSEDIKAIYAPSDKELCVVVDPRTGYLPNGKPNRDPAPKYTVTHRGL